MKQSISQIARGLVEEKIVAAGFTLWDVRYEKEGEDMNLVFELDRGENMSMSDCEEANDIINPIIDEADPIQGAYILEVSSAGLTRNLRTDYHFETAAQKGWNVQIKLYKAENGKKELSGKITEADGETITLEENKINRKNIAKATAILG